MEKGNMKLQYVTDSLDYHPELYTSEFLDDDGHI